MFCPKCGKDIPAGARFCENCGAAAPVVPASQPYAPAPPGYYQPPPSQYQVPPPAYGPPAPYGMPPYGAVPMKNTGTAVVLAAVLGLIGFNGIGHMYVGKLTDGVLYLIIGWILILIAIFTWFGWLLWLIYWIWLIYDAYNKANQYNAAVQMTGRAPW